MISYAAIREGIAWKILQCKSVSKVMIDDETTYRVGEPAILVHLIESRQELFSKAQVRRVLDFSVTYLAPTETPTAEILQTGLNIVAALQPTIDFDGRKITLDDVSGQLVNKDFHITFTLDFYDELASDESYEFMNELVFKLALEQE